MIRVAALPPLRTSSAWMTVPRLWSRPHLFHRRRILSLSPSMKRLSFGPSWTWTSNRRKPLLGH